MTCRPLFRRIVRMLESDTDLGDAEVEQHAEADRREVDPPIQVETAMWSEAGQLDWWAKGTAGLVGSRTQRRWPQTVDQCC